MFHRACRSLTARSAPSHCGFIGPASAAALRCFSSSVLQQRGRIPPKAAAIIDLNQQLLDYISAGDWERYSALCCPTLTCFEAEARGAFVQGLAFHKIYYDHGDASEDRRAYMSEPHVRFLAGGRVAVLSYVRLVQKFAPAKGHGTLRVEETRVWEKRPEGWRLVHFHKSDLEKK